jgi:Mlc titration factor MtfA (ptsG expression regulator)
VARELAQISDDMWQAGVRRHAFLAGLTADQDAALRERAAWLLASKSFSGAQGLEVTTDIMLSVAIQAALPILALDPALYEGWTEIVLYPGGFLIPRTDVDESGVVHEYVTEASGEAWEGGPVILSWEDSAGGHDPRVNVVIHEFAHKLDLYAGEADGIPSLHMRRDIQVRQWASVLDESYDAFCRALEAVEAAIPADVDPESDAASPWYDTLPLDPYAAADRADFFAVSSEGFFVDPAPLARSLPKWYELLRAYYRQDPLERLG